MAHGGLAMIEPNCEVEECACCGGSIYMCLWCGYETPSAVQMDDHECEPPHERAEQAK